MYKKILVPLDGSDLAESVLPHVRELVRCTGAQVVLVRVIAVPVTAYMVGTDPRMALDLHENAEVEAIDYLDGVAARLRAEGIQVTAEIGRGVIAETIGDFSQNVGADLIAMSTHGRGGLARLVIGSVADQLVRQSSVPILLIRPGTRD